MRLRGPEEIDRRERAPGAAAGMERMPSPPRARSSFCQPLSRPDRAEAPSDLGRHATPRWRGGDRRIGARWMDREPCRHAEMDGGDTHAARGRRLSQAAPGGKDMSLQLSSRDTHGFRVFFALDLIPFGQAAVAGLLPRKRMRMLLLMLLIPMARPRRGDGFKEYFASMPRTARRRRACS